MASSIPASVPAEAPAVAVDPVGGRVARRTRRLAVMGVLFVAGLLAVAAAVLCFKGPAGLGNRATESVQIDNRVELAVYRAIADDAAGAPATVFVTSAADLSADLLRFRALVDHVPLSPTGPPFSTELDDYYHELIRAIGVDRARHYYQSQVAAVNRIEAIVRELAIDCDFQRLDGFLVAGSTDHQALLEREFAACLSIDVDGVEWVDRAPFPGFDSGRALRFPNQAPAIPARASPTRSPAVSPSCR